MLRSPIFLVGAERSGTTLLRLMLDHHPLISWKQEFEYAVDLIEHNGKFPKLSDYYDWLETNRNFQSMGFEINRGYDFPSLVDSFLVQQQDGTEQYHIGATVHRNFDKLLYIWADARFIHIVRDPRDVARSCIGMGWAGNVWYGVDRWLAAETIWSNLESVLPKSRYLEISYEKLIKNSETVLKDISNFIGVEYSPSMLKYDKHSTYSAPDKSLVEQWRTKLTTKEIQQIELKTKKYLAKNGYKFSGIKSQEVSLIMKCILYIQNKIHQVKFRNKRMGFILFISDFISRRLGLENWQKHVKIKINDIDKKYLK